MSEQAYKIRSRWPRRLVFAVPVLASLGAAAWMFARGSAEREGASALVDEIVERWMEEGAIAGLAVGVRQGGQTLHAAGYGRADLENDLAASSETVFHVGSLTKQFTAAAVLKMAEAGTLRLDDPGCRSAGRRGRSPNLPGHGE